MMTASPECARPRAQHHPIGRAMLNNQESSCTSPLLWPRTITFRILKIFPSAFVGSRRGRSPECARPRAQHHPIGRACKITRNRVAQVHCCGRGRSHSALRKYSPVLSLVLVVEDHMGGASFQTKAETMIQVVGGDLYGQGQMLWTPRWLMV